MAQNSFIIKARNRTFCGFEKENGSEWNGPFSFIQGADTQFGMVRSYPSDESSPTYEEEIELTTKAVKAVNEMTPRPKFFVVCGDLVDAFPGRKYRAQQENDFIRLFAELHPDIPLVCICGNHDIGNTPTPSTIQSFTDKFGDDYFSFFVGGVMFIVLNSQFYEDRSMVEELAQKQDEWLEKQLKEAKCGGYKHVVVLQHIPWFVKEPDEDKIYFNIEIELRKTMLEKFHSAGVSAIFCGHYHRNDGGFYKNMELIVTSAIGMQLGNDKSGFRIVRVFENAIKHEYYPINDDLPKTIDLLQ